MQVKWPYLKIHAQNTITSHLTPCKVEKEVHTTDLFILIKYEFERVCIMLYLTLSAQ